MFICILLNVCSLGEFVRMLCFVNRERERHGGSLRCASVADMLVLKSSFGAHFVFVFQISFCFDFIQSRFYFQSNLHGWTRACDCFSRRCGRGSSTSMQITNMPPCNLECVSRVQVRVPCPELSAWKCAVCVLGDQPICKRRREPIGCAAVADIRCFERISELI